MNAYLSGTASRKQLSDIFGYTTATISNWVRAYKQDKRLAPRPNGHRKSLFTTEELKQLSELLKKNVGLTLAELREHFGKQCSLIVIHKTVAKLGSSSKKTLKASEQEREDIVSQHEQWLEYQQSVSSERLIFLDETGVKTNITRLYGRSTKGERCHDKAPEGRWETVTVLSSVRLDGTTESIMFEGALDRKMLEAYIERFLAPSLRPGDIVIIDAKQARVRMLPLPLTFEIERITHYTYASIALENQNT